MAKSIARSEQFLRLNREESKRYLSKIAILDGIDPYTLKMDELSDDIAILPPLRYLFMICYSRYLCFIYIAMGTLLYIYCIPQVS